MKNLNKDFQKARLAKIKELQAKLAELTRVWEDGANNVTVKEYIVEFDKTKKQIKRLQNGKN
jgi:hypothetical protein|tara:strand:+ start:241 stop:426 length:186 start_codon:yes stop_codon:yes gene_type:complete